MPIKRIYNKLGRDLIRKQEEERGCLITAYECDDAEYRQRLCEKLQEEVAEFLADESLEELGDVLEVVNALAISKGIDLEELNRQRIAKTKRNGCLDRVFIQEILHVEECPWAFPKNS